MKSRLCATFQITCEAIEILLPKSLKRSMKKYNPERILNVLSVIVALIGMIILAIFCYRLLKNGYGFIGPLDLEASSKTGDFIGGVVAPFWGLATLLLLVITLRLQRKGLQETGKALELQRTSIREAGEAFHRQQIENNFYNLMRTQRDIINGIEVDIQFNEEKERSTKAENSLQKLVRI